MNTPHKFESPPQSFATASFADSFAKQYARYGGSANDLFVVFTALVGGASDKIAIDAFIALDEIIGRGTT